MGKKNKTPFGIFIESIGLYFSNFDKFVKYMSFPVLGQLVGLILIFGLTYLYTTNLPFLIEKYHVFDNFNTLVLASILVTLPGMIIFLKAFWEYLVAYGAINSMLENMLRSGRVYDFDAHTELIKRRSLSYVALWCLIGIFSLFAMMPLLWVPAGVVFIYAVLIFQIFTFEPEQSPVGCVKRSFELIKGHFLSTFLLVCLAGGLTYYLIPQIFNCFFEVIKLNLIFANWAFPLLSLLPISEINDTLTFYHLMILDINIIALMFSGLIVAQILIQYTLPLRSILWGMWYKELNGEIPTQNEPVKKKRKTTKFKTKRPSEKLMEASHKKYSVKKLDRNLLRRAMEKDDEEY